MRCKPHFRSMNRRRDIWSVGCACGWLCDHPLRGTRDRARGAWEQHRDEMETSTLGRLMRQVPRGGDV